jgi:8-oxo-dGTP pyrophosphatase MutT (NUDIX family)
MPPKKKGGGNPFVFEGPLKVSDSATVILLRRAANQTANSTLTPSDLTPEGGPIGPMIELTLENENQFEFMSGWEVLMGQNEVKNWMRSTKDSTKTMSFPGEYKFAGGVVDKGESIAAAAARELEEEFLAPCGLTLPADAILRPFIVKQTRPIRGKSAMMYNFVAIADENPWLENLDLDFVNQKLADKRTALQPLVESGEFWEMSKEEKELVSPEVHSVKWMSLRDAVWSTLTSMNMAKTYFINDYMREEFAMYGVKRRDPMFITCAAIVELEGFPSAESLTKWCDVQSMETLAEEEQWLFAGMKSEETERLLHERLAAGRVSGLNPSFKSMTQIAALREKRASGQVKSRL